MSTETGERPIVLAYSWDMSGLLRTEEAGGHTLITVDDAGLDNLIGVLQALKDSGRRNVILSTEDFRIEGRGLAIRRI